MKRGRPKGRSNDRRSFGPLGDLIRKHRLERQLGLMDVAKACQCSVQFISNIEHGRAPLPWEKVGQMAAFLKIPVDDLQAANLAIRSDFQSFVKLTRGGTKGMVLKKGNKVPTPNVLAGGAATALAYTAKDAQLREVISRYQSASPNSRKRFLKAALKMLDRDSVQA